MRTTIIHSVSGTLAMLLIATFWTSTVISELFLDTTAVVVVKHCIAFYGLASLAILMAITGGSGFSLSKDRKGRLIDEKKKRMPIIGINGLLIMIPVAIFLNIRASEGMFDTWFYTAQALELATGLVQLTMMSRNFQAGLRLAGRLRVKTPR
ncbi:hypothetical protein [Xenorhabdus budapestensis]|uniref:Transmembrane protein n=1 Tax=Xenorhabdus budapestensis TaxID=290110 RepID=A0A2D0J309_XENBU|nr:hypothetical protein [Xenorhabdus budapestensis]PHM28720.1 hypothetical protein Xbud_01317 [Xenorhabdus budapestensis]QTL38262.1 hypothetical protein HGO23_09960 [Xenorhabdus budapestensis]